MTAAFPGSVMINLLLLFFYLYAKFAFIHICVAIHFGGKLIIHSYYIRGVLARIYYTDYAFYQLQPTLH